MPTEPTRTVLGHSVHRTEDPAILTGGAEYVDDVAFRERVVAGGVRARDRRPRRLRDVDTDEARTMPGVLGVFTDDDLGLPPARRNGP